MSIDIVVPGGPVRSYLASSAIGLEDVETKNVTIEAWIYWSKQESDHDFHVIVGDTPLPDENTILLNTEVSGLPPENPTHAELLQGRLLGRSIQRVYRAVAQRG